MTDLLPELVRIPAGPFLMGADEGDTHQRPAHVVTLDQFMLGSSPVTNAEYGRFVRATERRPPGVWELPAIARFASGDRFRELSEPYCWNGFDSPAGKADHPVVLVTYEDASEYCRWLKHKTGRPFRLPTEAEAEKAARGGFEGRRYPWGDSLEPSEVGTQADPPINGRIGTRPAASLPANGYGVFGAAGHVWTWVADWYRADYYTVSDTLNPRGPASGSLRLLRGGGWTNQDERYLQCACRHAVPPDTYSYSIGFRVACAVQP
jgi:sulfatase modifying factor 1